MFYSVTVFGESAGGASATYLMMSPLAKGEQISNYPFILSFVHEMILKFDFRVDRSLF